MEQQERTHATAFAEVVKCETSDLTFPTHTKIVLGGRILKTMDFLPKEKFPCL